MLIIFTPPSHFLSSVRADEAPIRQQRGSRLVRLVNYASGQAFLKNAASLQSDLAPLTAADAVFSHGQRTNETTNKTNIDKKTEVNFNCSVRSDVASHPNQQRLSHNLEISGMFLPQCVRRQSWIFDEI